MSVALKEEMGSGRLKPETARWSCLSCRSNEFRRLRHYRTHTTEGKALWNQSWLCECQNCQLVQALPRPASQALTQYYVDEYRRGGYAGSDVAEVQEFPKDNLFYYNRGQSMAELLRAYLQESPRRILDIGAGYGHILHALGEQFPGSTRQAIEYSEPCVQHLKAIGVVVDSSPVETVLPQQRNQFDLIVLSHVLEHLLDPEEVLRLIHDSLAPGGILYIEVPNVSQVLGYADHQWAPRFDEPHITFFNVTTLCRFLKSVGYKRRFCETAGPYYKQISPVRYHLPPLKATLLNLLPRPLFRYLRRRRFTQPLRVKQREECFYQYGGLRLWIRGVWQKGY